MWTSIQRRALVVIALVLSSLLRVSAVRADDTAAAAESLFRAGKALMDEGNYRDACMRFKESHNADPSVGALLNLALCNEKQGKMASAWAYYGDAAVLAGKLRDPERQAGAEKLASELEARVSKLAVYVTAQHDGLEVTRDGTPVPSFGAALPVDPGRYEIVARARGRAAWTTTIEVGPNGDSQSVTVPELEAADTSTPDAASDGDVSWQTIAGWSLVGVGVVGITVGVIFGAIATSNAGQLERDCPEQRCPPGEATDLLSTTKTQATVSTVAIAVGALAGVGGVVLLLLPADVLDGDVAVAPLADAGAALRVRF